MLTLDCLGDICPLPAMRLSAALDAKHSSEILLITDHSCVSASITDLCKKRGLSLDIREPLPGVWELLIKI